MEQPDFFTIPSPCIGVCQANAKGYCKGCFRSREERLYWLHMSDEQKHQVMRMLAARRKKWEHLAWEKQRPSEDVPEQGDLLFD